MVGTALMRLCPSYELELPWPSLRGAKRRSNPSLLKRRHGLLRFARNDEIAWSLRQSNPTGKSPETLSIPLAKNIPLNASGKSAALLRPSHPNEGRIAIVTDVRWDAVDAMAAQDECRSSRTAKSCGPDAAVLASSLRMRIDPNGSNAAFADDGGKRAVHRGEHEVSRKATAQGRPECFR